MPDIRVDPPALRQTAAKFRQAADRVLALAEEGEETAASAPSYDGQFGPQVQSLGLEAHAQMTAVATKLTALSEALLIKAEEFEAADRETEGGLAGLFAQFRAWIASLGRPQGPLALSLTRVRVALPGRRSTQRSGTSPAVVRASGDRAKQGLGLVSPEHQPTPLRRTRRLARNWRQRKENRPIFPGPDLVCLRQSGEPADL